MSVCLLRAQAAVGSPQDQAPDKVQAAFFAAPVKRALCSSLFLRRAAGRGGPRAGWRESHVSLPRSPHSSYAGTPVSGEGHLLPVFVSRNQLWALRSRPAFMERGALVWNKGCTPSGKDLRGTLELVGADRAARQGLERVGHTPWARAPWGPRSLQECLEHLGIWHSLRGRCVLLPCLTR